MRCFDFRVLEDRVSFRTTFVVGLFSMSDSEFALSLVVDSDDLLVADVDAFFVATAGAAAAAPFLLLATDFLVGGEESALDSVSDSL